MTHAAHSGADTVLVCGAGPVGCAFALLMNEFGGPSTLVVDARPDEAIRGDARMLALSHGSRVLLERVGAWQASLATPIERIHVSQRGHFGRTFLQASDYSLPALGYVVPYAALAKSLRARLREVGVVTQFGQTVQEVAQLEDGLAARFSGGQEIRARYLVHAEGGLYGTQTRQPRVRDYRQSAVTSFVTVEHPLANQAWERFTAHGPLALLPAHLDGVAGLALVWCCAPEDGIRRAGLSDDAFLAELHDCFGDRLGAFLTSGPRQLFELGLNAADESARGREFAIGNAAQTLHPVAGQGLNLGLRDATTLAQLMADSRLDAPELAARFNDARRMDRAATIRVTDLLPRVFASRLAAVTGLRAAALTLLDLLPTPRRLLARHMMDGLR